MGGKDPNHVFFLKEGKEGWGSLFELLKGHLKIQREVFVCLGGISCKSSFHALPLQWGSQWQKLEPVAAHNCRVSRWNPYTWERCLGNQPSLGNQIICLPSQAGLEAGRWERLAERGACNTSRAHLLAAEGRPSILDPPPWSASWDTALASHLGRPPLRRHGPLNKPMFSAPSDSEGCPAKIGLNQRVGEEPRRNRANAALNLPRSFWKPRGGAAASFSASTRSDAVLLFAQTHGSSPEKAYPRLPAGGLGRL